MRVYHERLTVPPSWWLLGMAVVVILGAELAAGLRWVAVAGICGALGAGYAALLISWGRARIEISDGELRAGRARLPLRAVEEVIALDPGQTRAIRGARADPAAFLVVRPYLRETVYLRIRPASGGTPYWLVGTRRPSELARALGEAGATCPAGDRAVG